MRSKGYEEAMPPTPAPQNGSKIGNLPRVATLQKGSKNTGKEQNSLQSNGNTQAALDFVVNPE